MVALRSMVACLFMLTLGLPLTAESQPSSAPEFIPLATPCRALDTRVTGTPVPANAPTTIQISGVTTGPGGDCGVPATAVGAALNFTITQAQGLGHLTVWSSGDLPVASVVNFSPARMWPMPWISGSGRAGPSWWNPSSPPIWSSISTGTSPASWRAPTRRWGTQPASATPRASRTTPRATTPPWGPAPSSTTPRASATPPRGPRPPRQHHGQRQHRHGGRRPRSATPRATGTPPRGSAPSRGTPRATRNTALGADALGRHHGLLQHRHRARRRAHCDGGE